MSDRASRVQLAAQLADRCEQVSLLRAELAAMAAELDEWREIARAQLVRNAELSRDRVVVLVEPKTTGRKLGSAESAQVQVYRAAMQQTRGQG